MDLSNGVLLCPCGVELVWHLDTSNWESPVAVEDGYLIVEENFDDPYDIRDYYQEGLYCPHCREFVAPHIEPDDDVADYEEELKEAGIRLAPKEH